MNRFAFFVLAAALHGAVPATVDYPPQGAMFPPEFPAPTFVWRDPSPATAWTIDISFANGAAPLNAISRGEGLRIGPIDQRAIGPTNRLPQLTREQATAHTWTPDAATWAAIKSRAAGSTATFTIKGRGTAATVTVAVSTDPVGAPVFYRDVPLMPSETEKGVVKPLAKNAIPLIAWRLRDLSKTESRVLMTGIHSCANCHSVSADGKTMGMDLDGPRNDKGLYAIFPIRPQAAIREENVVAWSTFQGKLGGKLRVGFMSQISPQGRYVITTINDPGPPQSDYAHRRNPRDLVSNYYVANFTDYRFLQVFYPTRGILAYYSHESGKLQPLPGADDPAYVHTNAVWSRDGSYLVFARAQAQDAYAPGAKIAERANDPNETQIQYDLYRIPFNDGRGGKAEPVKGASANGMSNSFPKISPDGKWIVFVKARNGQLMRPDSQLYIVPTAGGEARRMHCNTPLMNSWHSFSPNGRWMVFSSKSASPYTRMFLTHIDENGNDTPAVMVDNSTAANRAVNIPEFVNVAPDGFQSIAATVTDYYRLIDNAEDALEKKQYAVAVAAFQKAVAANPNEPIVENSLGLALIKAGRAPEALEHFEKSVRLTPDYPEPYSNLGAAYARAGKAPEALAAYQKAIELDPEYPEAHSGYGTLLMETGDLAKGVEHLERGVGLKPEDANARANLALALARAWRAKDAIPHAEQAVKLTKEKDAAMLELLGSLYAEVGRFPDAVATERRALAEATRTGRRDVAATAQAKVALYQAGKLE